MVNGYTGAYDGSAHAATGTATGVGGADRGVTVGARREQGPGCGQQQQRTDDDDGRVEHRCERGDALAEPTTQ